MAMFSSVLDEDSLARAGPAFHLRGPTPTTQQRTTSPFLLLIGTSTNRHIYRKVMIRVFYLHSLIVTSDGCKVAS